MGLIVQILTRFGKTILTEHLGSVLVGKGCSQWDEARLYLAAFLPVRNTTVFLDEVVPCQHQLHPHSVTQVPGVIGIGLMWRRMKHKHM